MTTVLLPSDVAAIVVKGHRNGIFRKLAYSASTLGLIWAVAACSGTPAKEWEINASSAQKNAIEAYLNGDNARYKAEAQRLRHTLGATGKTILLTRAELSLCAVQVASLVNGPCEGYLPRSFSASPAEKAYEAFLNGDFDGLKSDQGDGTSVSNLPPHYQLLLKNPAAITSKTFQDAPLSALVASAVLFRRGELGPEGIAQAVEIASDQGWRRPLLAWLGVQEALFKAAGEQKLAQAVRRRIDMATK